LGALLHPALPHPYYPVCPPNYRRMEDFLEGFGVGEGQERDAMGRGKGRMVS